MDISKVSNQINFDSIKNKIDSNSDKNFEKVINKAMKDKDTKKLKKACKDFESIFVNMLLKNMRNTVSESDMVKKSHAREMFEGMLDEEISKNISNGDGIGIADILYENLKDKGSSIDYKG